MKWIKRLFCKHDYQLVSRYQDIGYVTFMAWECTKCKKERSKII